MCIMYCLVLLNSIVLTLFVLLMFLCYFCQAAVSAKISYLLICFCSFDFSCSILETDNCIVNVYNVLSN